MLAALFSAQMSTFLLGLCFLEGDIGTYYKLDLQIASHPSGPNIWLEYGQYSVGGIGQKGGLEKVRSVFERALSSVGLHVTKGLAIWEAYREFESAIVEAARVSPQVMRAMLAGVLL